MSHFSQCSQILEGTCHEFGDDGNTQGEPGSSAETSPALLAQFRVCLPPSGRRGGSKETPNPFGTSTPSLEVLWWEFPASWRENPQDQTQRPPR